MVQEDPPVCGNGVVEGTEACDDGNQNDADECNNQCKVAGCGDGIVNFAEACDDGNQVDGDGCDNNCTQSYCGNGVLAPDEECDDGNRTDGDGCDNNCTPSACGNGVAAGTEECDDGNATEGDGCDTNCTMSSCGNGITGGSETCDDGANVSGDGCSATCNTEQAEIEPNDDGTPATGASGITGNDFATAAPDANGPITASATISASISPAGDEDIFKIVNTSTENQRITIDTWNVATGFDIGISCGSSIDTGIQVKNAAGTVLASNDNRSTSDKCSSVEIALRPGDVRYVQIVELGDNAVIPNYVVDIAFEPIVCGDSNVGPFEQCDDGNTATGDGCSATCQIEGAIGEIEPNEDGSPSTGGSGTTGNDFGSVFPLNNGTITDTVTILGSISPSGDEDIFAFANLRNNSVTVNLDVWNMAAGFGIGVPCGTSIDTGLQIKDLSGSELTSNDDRASSADRCSTITMTLLPGETRFAQLLSFGDTGIIPSYALVIKYTNIVCGDSVVSTGETCDDGNTVSGDGCDSNCQIEPFCGDNIMQSAEWCDDGNSADGDGCSAICEVEDAVQEIEPNDDGSVSVSSNTSNDFSSAAADANGAYTAPIRIVGRIRPAGDEDVYAFTNPSTTTAVTAHFITWSNAPGFGPGVACPSAADTMMHVRDAAGTSLASNDQAAFGGNCSEITIGILAGQTVYVHVYDWGDNDQIPSYMLDATYTPVPCGDGIVGIGEQCDDSNAANNDGCSSTCQLENAFTEVEPNDDGSVNTSASGITGNDFSSANANGPFTTSKRIIAKLSPAGDEDVFAFTNPLAGPVQAKFDTWSLAAGKGIGVACGTTINTGIHIRNAAGTSLQSNDDRNGSSDRCSTLTYTLAAGETVYAHVVASGDNTVIPSYVLDAQLTPIICGDSIIGPTEQCDDGNAVSGDGCSSTCQLEIVCGNGILQTGEQCDDANANDNDGCSSSCQLEAVVAEVEPNATSADADASPVQISGNANITGAISPNGDLDRFKVTVATATVVRFETFTAWNDCSTATFDMRLFDSAGNQIVIDKEGSGINQCAAIVMYLAAGTYYVQVEERGNNASIASYRLQVSFLSDQGMETEPNNTNATASTNFVGHNETYVFGDHMMSNDVDVYAIAVPPGGRIRAEIIEGDRSVETCEQGGVDSRILLFDEIGGLIAEDNDTGRGLCSLIDGTGTTALDPTARNTSSVTKTFYLAVQTSALATMNNSQFIYRLAVTIR